MSHGTVQRPLTSGEALEFGAAVMQQLGRDIDPEKARYYIGHKSELGKDLRKLGIHKMPEYYAGDWETFYKSHFGYTAGFEGLRVAQKPEYPCRDILVLPGLTNNQVFDACTEAFKGKTWRYESDLNTVKDVVNRPDVPYVIWVRDLVEADLVMANQSAEDIEKAGTNTLTLKERMLLELKYHGETGEHLDRENVTLCAGSRYSDGFVPNAYWGGEFFVYWSDVLYRHPDLRARVVVS